jgi:hypothetical protein
MITTLIKIIFVIYLVMSILEIRNIHVYNLKSDLLVLKDNINEINVQSEIENLSPLLLKNIYDDNLDNENLLKKNPGYMILDMEKYISFKELKDIYNIYENEKIVKDLDIDVEQIFKLFDNKLTTNKRSYLSLYGDNIQSVLLKCVHNMTSYTCSKNITFYLFNPKHFHDIFGKELQKIKKWALKVELEKGDILYIPSEWNYIYEGKGNLLKTTFDNYFSVGYNFIRE